jgi:hypothetical protein
MLPLLFLAFLGAEPPPVAAAVPDGQKAKAAKEIIEKMRASLKKLGDASKESRAAKDAVKLSCVAEKQSQATGLVAVAETSEAELTDALKRKDEEVAAHAFDKISLAGQKVTQLQADSNTCIGELAVYAGDTIVIATNEGDSDDPTILIYVVPFLPRPVQVSPYQ